MPDAHSLHCPNCGAAVDVGVQRCPYCRARLATISCPSCFAPMFDTAAFCQKCGHRRARVAADDTAAKCPGCRNALQHVDVGGTTLMECAACDGIWIEAGVFEKVCNDRAAQAAVLHRTPGKRPSGVERVRYRPCVQCGKMMNRVNFGRMSGTVVDVCRGHGTFLDAGELHQIVEFIHGGGLDRARERQIEELKEQERQLQARERQAHQQHDSPHAWLETDGAGQISGSALIGLIEMISGK